jgi:putative DNA primase/helicase
MSELHTWARALGDDPILCKDFDFVREKIGLRPWKPNGHARPSSTKRHFFDYRGPDGALLYQVEREDLPDGGKKIRQRRPDGNGGWLWSLGGVNPVPYRLPELLEALAHDRTIVIAEGEAKVDLLWRWNVPATCNSGGAGKWRAEHSAFLRGADVVVLPDNDEPGRRHARTVAASLEEAGATVRVLDLPGLGPKGDVIDWAAAGGTVEQLHALIENEARPWAPSDADKVTVYIENAKGGGTTVMQDAATLEMETIEWYWLHWLALGKLHLIAGAPEAGKTTIALALAATISSGSYWPDGTRAPTGNVLIWTSEDSLADTIKPRLVRMGADLTRIKFIVAQRTADGKTRPFCPATDMPSLIEAAKTLNGGVQLLIIDPIVAAIGTKTNSHNNAETRNSLQPVVDFAETANCAVIGISHFTKGTNGKDPIERVTGSLAFGALPRIVFAAAKTDETAEGDMLRIFVRAKSNIGPSGGGFGYDIDAAPLMERLDIIATRVVWLEPIEGTARDLLDAAGPQPENTKKENAEVFLLAVIPKGEKRLQTEIEEEAKANGISKATLRRAKVAAKVKSTQAQGAWWWSRE